MFHDPRLIEILRCPACRSTVRPLDDDPSLICTSCARVYPIIDGIPVMLVEEAKLKGPA